MLVASRDLTRSSSDRAGCRTRYRGSCRHPGHMRRTSVPFRLLVVSMARWSCPGRCHAPDEDPVGGAAESVGRRDGMRRPVSSWCERLPTSRPSVPASLPRLQLHACPQRGRGVYAVGGERQESARSPKVFDQMMYYGGQAKLPNRKKRRPSYPRAVWGKPKSFPHRRR